MDLYLNAIGFSQLKEKDDIKKIMDDIIKSPTYKYISNYGEDTIKVEYRKEYHNDFGLLVRGELNDKEELTVHSLAPYKNGVLVTDTKEVEIMTLDDKEHYYVYCEELKSATPITFYLQNVVDYLDIKEDEDVYIDGVKIVGLSVEGTVILPINKEEIDLLLEEEEEKWREELVEQARDGDEEAMELLEIEALETTEIIHERLQYEDLLSILDGYFMPDASKEAIYSMLGNIEEVELAKNNLTGEEIYIIQLSCMNTNFEVCINKKDIVGIPTKGMRFKGTCWLQGHVEFS